jgi:hypothetical protein
MNFIMLPYQNSYGKNHNIFLTYLMLSTINLKFELTTPLVHGEIKKTNCVKGVNLLSLYLSVKRSHHVRREGLEIPTLIQKREEYTPLDFMKI